MTPNPHLRAKKEFIEHLQHEASKYDTTITPAPHNIGYKREGDFIARFRSTTEQSRGTFQTTDPRTDQEIAANIDVTERFDSFLIVVLNLTRNDRFKPGVDEYYPLTFGQFAQFVGDKHASGRLQATIHWEHNIIQRNQDDVKKALQCEEINVRLNDNKNSDNNLQEIARRVESKWD
jgi:hypothetical protein